MTPVHLLCPITTATTLVQVTTQLPGLLNWFPHNLSCLLVVILSTAARVIFLKELSHPVTLFLRMVQWFSTSLKISFNLLAILQGLATYGSLAKSTLHLLLYGP